MSISNPTLLLLLTIISLQLSIISSIQPENPIKCSSGTKTCTITNSIGSFPDQNTCNAGEVTYPTSEKHLISIIAAATNASKKMRVATKYIHSRGKLVCPDGDDGLIISTRNLDKILEINEAEKTITVEGGVMLSEVIEVAARSGLVLPYTPYWSGVTIAGLISTGAHGSSIWGKGSAVHEYVIGMRIVSPGPAESGFVSVRSLSGGDPDLDAAKVSLGVLGVISQVTLQLEPMFKRSITYEVRDDHDLEEQVTSFGKLHEFADFMWYPNQRKAVYRIDDRVPLDVLGQGQFSYLAFEPVLPAEIEKSAAIEENYEATSDAGGKCNSAKEFTLSLQKNGYGLTNNGLNFTGYPVVGYQNELQSFASCIDVSDTAETICHWDPRYRGLFYHITSLSIALSEIKSFLSEVKKLFDMIPESTCGIEMYNGILMRYVKASSAYLGKEEDSIEFDIMYYRSRDPMVPRMYEDVIEEVEQMAVFKYGALPHWGKNRNVAFEGVADKYKKVGMFLKVKEEYDPMGLFSCEWTDGVLGLGAGVSIARDGCALEGLCVCSEDSHCAPHKGYFCKPGKVYKEARVCTLISYNKHTEL